jgi:hypothetical protein
MVRDFDILTLDCYAVFTKVSKCCLQRKERVVQIFTLNLKNEEEGLPSKATIGPFLLITKKSICGNPQVWVYLKKKFKTNL